jgi:hypothetical protein
MLDNAEARAYVVRELGKHRNPKEVIFELCNEHGVEWKDAEGLVRDVQIYDEKHIARRQSPLLIILGFGALAGGFMLTGSGLYLIWEALFVETDTQLALIQSAYYIFGAIVTGIAMIAGGVIGFRRYFGCLLS